MLAARMGRWFHPMGWILATPLEWSPQRKNEFFHQLDDPLDAETATDDGVFAFILVGEAAVAG